MGTTRSNARKQKEQTRAHRDRIPVAPTPQTWTGWRTLIAAVAVALVAACLYLPIRRHPFISFDDGDYVTENLHVSEGLSWYTVVWAWTSLEAVNWHPVTWMSHAAERASVWPGPRGSPPHELVITRCQCSLGLPRFGRVNSPPGLQLRSSTAFRSASPQRRIGCLDCRAEEPSQRILVAPGSTGICSLCTKRKHQVSGSNRRPFFHCPGLQTHGLNPALPVTCA